MVRDIALPRPEPPDSIPQTAMSVLQLEWRNDKLDPSYSRKIQVLLVAACFESSQI